MIAVPFVVHSESSDAVPAYYTASMSFDANGGSGAPETQEVTLYSPAPGEIYIADYEYMDSFVQDIYLTIPDQIPQLDGYTFLGWKLDWDDTLYQPGKIPMLDISASSFDEFSDPDVVFRAIWQSNESGTGTIDDPYRGVLDVDMEDWTYPTFIEVGTVFNVYCGDQNEGYAWTIQGGEDFGLSMNESGEHYITGTVDRVGIAPVTKGQFGTWDGGNAIGVVIFVPAGYHATGSDYLYKYERPPFEVENIDSLDGTEILSLLYIYSYYSSDAGEYSLYSGSPIFVDGYKLISAGDNSVSSVDGYIAGVLDGTEPVVLEIVDEMQISPRYLTLQPYTPYETLAFESDPISDGILVPPNHHMVRFIGSDGVLIGYDIVEHGGFMQLPDGHESDLWSESADVSSGLFDTSRPVESDMNLHVYTGPTVEVDKSSLTLYTDSTPSSSHVGVTTVDGVTWTISHSAPDVVSVVTDEDGFIVTAVSTGDASITVIPSVGEPMSIEVMVSVGPLHDVDVIETEGITVEVSPQQATVGQTVTVHFALDRGKHLDSIRVTSSDGSEITVSGKDSMNRQFVMPDSDVTVQAVLAGDIQ